MTEATVVFLKNPKGEVCLARKKQAIHDDTGEISYSLGIWNGYGGKREDVDESIEATAIRELFDESSVKAKKGDLKKCGDVSFYLHKEGKDVLFMDVVFYTLSRYKGEPKEGDEMGYPQFFGVDTIPYNDMMPADKILLPKMFRGEVVKANVVLYGKDKEPLVTFLP